MRARKSSQVGPGCWTLFAAAFAAVLVASATVAALAQPDSALAKKRARAASASSQLRGVVLSPNFAFAVGPFAQSDAADSQEIDETCALGGNLVRVGVSWPALEQDGPGKINQDYVAKLDKLMSERQRCGIRVIMELAGIPSWDNGGKSAIDPPTDGGAAFQRIVAWVLNRWPDLDALEVSNEPNLDRFWNGTPRDYANLVNAAVAAKRQVGASTQILGGVLALDGSNYLRQLYANGMRGEDGISLHPYSMVCGPVCTRFYDPAAANSPFRSAIENVHDVMLQNHDPAGLWLTEFGFATCPSQPGCVSDSAQASLTARSFQVAACYPYVRGLTAFTLRDLAVPQSWDPSNFEFHFGLMDSDFRPKPAFGAVRAVLSQLNSADARAARARASSKRKPRARQARRGASVSARKCARLLGKGRPARAVAKVKKRRR